MMSSKALQVLLSLTLTIVIVQGHSYHLGSCPEVEPMTGFDMNQFFGTWFVIQKTSTSSSCLVNNYTRTTEGELRLEQSSIHPVLGLGNVDHVYRYTGILTQPNKYEPASMRVRFPLSVAGDASYTILMTDYENYAVTFSCQKILGSISNRRSATILSRKRTLDKLYIDKAREKLNRLGIDPHDLSIISQKDCKSVYAEEPGLTINIDETTFTAGSAANVVRKAGEKIGDGIEAIGRGASTVYNRLSSGRNSDLEDDLP